MYDICWRFLKWLWVCQLPHSMLNHGLTWHIQPGGDTTLPIQYFLKLERWRQQTIPNMWHVWNKEPQMTRITGLSRTVYIWFFWVPVNGYPNFLDIPKFGAVPADPSRPFSCWKQRVTSGTDISRGNVQISRHLGHLLRKHVERRGGHSFLAIACHGCSMKSHRSSTSLAGCLGVGRTTLELCCLSYLFPWASRLDIRSVPQPNLLIGRPWPGSTSVEAKWLLLLCLTQVSSISHEDFLSYPSMWTSGWILERWIYNDH